MPPRKTSRCGTAAKVLCVMLSAALGSGCTTWRPVRPEGGGLRESLKRGEKLRVVTHDGREHVFYLADADDHGLVGVTVERNAHVAVRYSEIATVDGRRLSDGAKASVVVLGIAGAALAVYTALIIMVAASGGGNASGAAGTTHAVPERAR